MDNAATTKPHAEVVEVISQMLRTNYGNPSSQHYKGKHAKVILEASRETIAKSIGADSAEIYFTSGGTESNNLAISGACLARQETRGNIVTSSLEHASVTKTIRNLKKNDWAVDYVDAKDGDFALNQLFDALTSSTTLISVMSVQNELGYIFPIEQVTQMRDALSPHALVHSDAIQAFGKLSICPKLSGIDLLSMSSHKIGGPKGVGALYVRRGTKMFTTAFGGGQEKGLRSGTESLPLIAGFAKAVEITMSQASEANRIVADLRSYLAKSLRGKFSQVIFNSRPEGSPYIFSFTLPGIDSKQALTYLSNHGVYVSAASACASNRSTVPAGTWREKHPLVLQLAGVPKRLGKGTLRISFSVSNTHSDIDVLVSLLARFIYKQGELRQSRAAANH